MNIEDFETEERARLERNLAYAESGVKFIDIKAAYIDEGVKIGRASCRERV